ncbi:2OG-Fe dioxygenase family protein [Streptomyces sp. NBC_00820]|uniref:2OG-Fe dioxygenase family protein n=1 Tax=Streptomyces sp. NBC_00820 TaxID=2975842 RepID=UPI002ED14BF3|nr:2OG-Fe dioxygenase family protein [Streptomyces sp. NBC_00820]
MPGIEVTADVAHQIGARGFHFVGGSRFRLDSAHARSLADFARAWRELPTDRYLPDGAVYRRRRHARFLLDTRTGALTRDTAGGYLQSKEANPLTGGMVRHFAPLLDDQAENRFLRGLVRANAEIFGRCARTVPEVWSVEVHVIRVVTSGGTATLPSPEGRHRDGFDYIALHHMDRENVVGGASEVYDPGGSLLVRRTYTARLDSLYADDARVLHDVTPVLPRDDGLPGHRDMLLTSYTGTRPATGPSVRAGR